MFTCFDCIFVCLVNPLTGDLILPCLMRLLSSISEARFEINLFWAFSYSLLSLFLVSEYAQKHVSLRTCFCWYLALLQNFRDEVKGKRPLVYEDLFSETRTSVFLSLFRFTSIFFWCIDSGPRLNPSKLKLKSELRIEACQTVLRMHDSLLGLFILLLEFYFGMYCTIISVLVRKHCVNDDALSCLNGFLIHSVAFRSLLVLGRTGCGLPLCCGFS